MSRPDPRKLKDEAQEAVAKGKWKKALEAYEALARLETRDGAWPQKAGEMYRKLGRGPEAITALSRAADLYSQSGFLLKAIACCKLILDIDPNHTGTQGRLAALHAERGVTAPVTISPPVDGGPRAGTLSPPLEAAPRVATIQPALGRAPSSPTVSPAPARAPVVPQAPMERSTMDLSVDDIELEPSAPVPPPRPIRATAAPPPLPITPAPPRPERLRTLPPDATLDEVTLGEIVPGARITQEIPADAAYEIPLDDVDLEVEMSPGAPGELVSMGPGLSMAAAVFPRTPLFGSLDESRLRALIERVRLVQLEAGEMVFRQGDEGDGLYVVASGQVAVVLEAGEHKTELARLGEGAFFGEIALLTRQKRTASVVASEPADLLLIDRDTLLSLVDEHPAVLKIVLRFLRDRLIDSLTATSPLFSPFSGQERKELASRFVFIEAAQGATLLSQGARAPGLFVLLAGTGKVTTDGATVCRLGPGDMFGASALLGNGVAQASVEATSKCFLLELPRSHFNELIMTHPQVLEYLSSMAEERRSLLGELLGDDVAGGITVV